MMARPTHIEQGTALHESAAQKSAAQVYAEMADMPPRMTPVRRSLWFLAFLLPAAIVYWPTLREWILLAWQSNYHTHTVAIPLVAAGLLYQVRKALFAKAALSPMLGIPLILAGLLLYASSYSISVPQHEIQLALAVFSLIALVIGGFLLLFGRHAFRAGLYAFSISLLSVPLPTALLEKVLHVIRVGSTEVAAGIFFLTRVPFQRDGFVFSLPTITIEVTRECSGIHSSLALLVVSLVAGYLFTRSAWKRTLLVLLVFPIISLTNGLRIVILTLLAGYVDPRMAYGGLHQSGGVVFFALALLLLGAALRMLTRKELNSEDFRLPWLGKRTTELRSPHLRGNFSRTGGGTGQL